MSNNSIATSGTGVALGILQRIKQHLLTQNKKAITGFSTCDYRTAAGLTCAVGCLIPEKLYQPASEGAGVCTLNVRDGKWEAPTARPNEEALAKMLNAAEIPASPLIRHVLIEAQHVHDKREVAEWGTGMNLIIAKVENGTIS